MTSAIHLGEEFAASPHRTAFCSAESTQELVGQAGGLPGAELPDLAISLLPSTREVLIATGGHDDGWIAAILTAPDSRSGEAEFRRRIRILSRHTARESTQIEEQPPSRVEARTVDRVPARFIAFDREVAFVVADDSLAEVQDAVVIATLVSIFESLWLRGLPMAGSPAGGVARGKGADDVQRTIMQHLVNGDTEEKIGRRLGMSRRTVAAHVARISRQLGSTSRTQLGYLIAKANMLDW